MCKKGLTWESIFFIITFNKIQISRELVLDIYNLHIHLLDQAIGWQIKMKRHLACSLPFESNLMIQPL